MSRQGLDRAIILAGCLIVGLAGRAWAQPEEGDAAPPDPSRAAAPAAQDSPPEEPDASPEPQASPAGSTADAAGAAESPSSSASPAASSLGLISVDFKDADIRQVLRIISLKSGVDIVAGLDVEGLVTIKLTNVPWEQALDIILRTYGFTYERNGTIVRVLTIEALEQEALSTEVFPLDYANAKEVPDIVKEMLSDRGRVRFDERTNTVIVTDIPSTLFQIKRVIERLDQRTPQVLVEIKVVETRLSKDERLGIDWSDSLTLATSAVSLPTTFPFPGGSRLGKLGEHFIPRAGTFSPSTGASLPEGRVPEAGGQVTFGTLSTTGLSAVLNFLQSRTDTHIVSNPNISALNNQEAKIHIGEEYPIPNYSIDPTTGRTTITGYTPKKIGTVLTVTPHINPSDEIVVDLKPEVISFSANVTFDTGAGNSVSLPRFTTQTAQTQVRIRDSHTIAIAGLVKKTEAKTESKVPVLGDLPLLGVLFKSTSRYGGSDPVYQDLLIFLTVKLMEDGSQPAQTVAAAPEVAPY